MKEAILTTDHPEIIHSVWDSIPTDHKEAMMRSVVGVLHELHPDEEAPRFQEVVRASWCLGFHYCMLAMEQGALAKAGPQDRENN